MDHLRGASIRVQAPAEDFLEELQKQLADFRKTLEPGAAISVAVLLPAGRTIDASWFGYEGRSMIIVRGQDERGRDCRVLVSYNALAIVLTSIVGPASKSVRPIGFQSRHEDAGDK